MSMLNESNSNDSVDTHYLEDNIDIIGFIYALFRNWYWVLLCVILGFLGARLYLRYSVPIYRAETRILIKEDPSNSSGLSEEAVLSDLGLITNNKNILNEMQILRSRTLMKQVVDELNLDVTYRGIGRIKDSEYYRTSVVVVDSVRFKQDNNQNIQILIQLIDEHSFALNTNEGEVEYDFGEELILNGDTLWLKFQPEATVNGIGQIAIRIRTPLDVVALYLKKLTVREINEFGSVLSLSIEDEIPERAADILNKLVSVYNRAAIEDKNQVAIKTQEFIDERLNLLTRELSIVEGDVEAYKLKNNIPTEAGSSVDIALNELSAYDREVGQLEIKLSLLETIEGILKSAEDDYELIPAQSIIDESEGLQLLIDNYNTLIQNRLLILPSAAASNPRLIRMNEQIFAEKMVIIQSVSNLKRDLKVGLTQTKNKLALIQRRIGAIPTQERELLEIKRQQNIKENLYLFLLQKKEESALTSAVTTPNARVVDNAIPAKTPIAPSPLTIYAIGLMFGFIIPVGLIFIREFMDDKIYGESEIKKHTQAPLIGSITQGDKDVNIVVKNNSRSKIAEMFRLIRTNLNYLLNNTEDDVAQTLLITSGMGGDGKTFISVNMGMSLAIMGERVVVLGMDLRKPKLAEYLTNTSDQERPGISNCLIGETTADQIIYPTEHNENLFFIPSGPIPPNPAELLIGKNLDNLFLYLKSNFDYIIIDTAPVGLVADAFLLSTYSDASIFAARYGKTPKEMIRVLEKIRVDGKLKNLAIVLNGVAKSQSGYGYGYGYNYGYGYGYYEEEAKRSLLDRILRRK